MVDGTFDKQNQRIILCIDCFSLKELDPLISALLENYNINSIIITVRNG